jgi:hypothetical protein
MRTSIANGASCGAISTATSFLSPSLASQNDVDEVRQLRACINKRSHLVTPYRFGLGDATTYMHIYNYNIWGQLFYLE